MKKKKGQLLLLGYSCPSSKKITKRNRKYFESFTQSPSYSKNNLNNNTLDLMQIDTNLICEAFPNIVPLILPCYHRFPSNRHRVCSLLCQQSPPWQSSGRGRQLRRLFRKTLLVVCPTLFIQESVRGGTRLYCINNQNPLKLPCIYLSLNSEVTYRSYIIQLCTDFLILQV